LLAINCYCRYLYRKTAAIYVISYTKFAVEQYLSL